MMGFFDWSVIIFTALVVILTIQQDMFINQLRKRIEQLEYQMEEIEDELSFEEYGKYIFIPDENNA